MYGEDVVALHDQIEELWVEHALLEEQIVESNNKATSLEWENQRLCEEWGLQEEQYDLNLASLSAEIQKLEADHRGKLAMERRAHDETEVSFFFRRFPCSNPQLTALEQHRGKLVPEI